MIRAHPIRRGFVGTQTAKHVYLLKTKQNDFAAFLSLKTFFSKKKKDVFSDSSILLSLLFPFRFEPHGQNTMMMP